MVNRTTKLRWRRRLRRGKRQFEDIGFQAEERLERHLFRRLSRLPNVFRFTTGWILLLVLLMGMLVIQTRALDRYYLTAGPAPGGTYVEGILGSFTNANPIFATGSVDSSVSRLVFSSLFKFDQQNQLVGDLASGYDVDDRGVVYTVHLRPKLKWQDGRPLTAEDVVYTYQTIQNPDAGSPLAASWQGINAVALNPSTVVFTLPNALTAFPFSLTNGIVPKHLLSKVPFAQLRSNSFNTARPIGSGPFKWQAVQVIGQTVQTREEEIALIPNDLYYGDRVKLNKFIIRSFQNQDNLVKSFKSEQLNAAAGLTNTPRDVTKDLNVHEYSIPLQSEVMIFLKNSSPVLSDARLRQAITMATNTSKVISRLGYPVIPARGPILKSHSGYDPNLTQLAYNPSAADQLLTSLGWIKDSRGTRRKDGQPLSFTLYAPDSSDYSAVASELQKQWKEAGINIELIQQSPSDLQTIISVHGYDALLYGLEIGSDPDVYAYWASSQADIRSATRLNLSEYKSSTADSALEAGRTRTDPALRAIKYKPFLQAWRDDAPAISLYQPRFLYLTRGQVYGLEPTIMNVETNRYANVNNWMIREAKNLK